MSPLGCLLSESQEIHTDKYVERKPLYTGGNIHGYEGTTTVENNTKIPQEIKMDRPYHAAVTLGGQPQDRVKSPRVIYILRSYTHYLQ